MHINPNPNPDPNTTRKPDSNNSPEFEFPHCSTSSPPTLHSADQIFSHGFLLPLHHLLPDLTSQPDPTLQPDQEPEPSSSLSSSTTNSILSASKRWKEIFTLGDKKSKSTSKSNSFNNSKANNYNGKNIFTATVKSTTSSGAELNINIWPFTRSRSAGNNANRTRPVTNRKVNSAPCSRSNSSVESKMMRRSWTNSPGRAGVHLGRSGPVWKIKKNLSGLEENRKGFDSSEGGVSTCVDYRRTLSCQSDENDPGNGGRHGGHRGGKSVNLFGLRGLFSKKEVLTV